MTAKNNKTPKCANTSGVSNSPVNHEKTDMKSLAKTDAKSTNGIIISDIKIHMDAEGRYSLNDLHAAAGKFEKDKPANWLRAEKTVELIDEILNSQIRAIKDSGNSNSAELQIKKPVDSKKGRYGGTYVCKELVYSYGMWISAAFALKVIRAYDALVSGDADNAMRIAKTTVNERTPLRDAVNLLVGKKGLRYDDAYNMVHQRFNIDSIDELDLEQIPLAVECVHRIALEGEFLGKQEVLPESAAKQFTDSELYELVCLWSISLVLKDGAEKIIPALDALGSPWSRKMSGNIGDISYFINRAGKLLMRESSHIAAMPNPPVNWRLELSRLKDTIN